MDRNPQDLWEEYRDKIAEAKSQDFKRRAEAWVQLPHRIAGTILPPLTLRKLIFLDQIDSPLLNGEDAGHEDVVTFIWVCSKDFTADEASARAFRAKHQKLPDGLGEEIGDYLTDNLSCLSSNGKESSDNGEHFASSIIDLIASQYGWGADTILDTPLVQLFQLLDSITHRLTVTNGGSPVRFNPEVDKLKAEFIRQARDNN